MIRLRASGNGAHRRRNPGKRTIIGFAVLALATLGLVATSSPASASVSTDAGFEFADGNLVHNTLMDWNDFAPTTWVGSAPYRTSSKTVSGWAFTGLEDAAATTSDTAFAGGVKQDNDCGTLSPAKAPNKDDLKRVYVTSKTVGGQVFLGLAWVRIPQNTTSPSAHIGFEFNKGTTPCPAPSTLVRRTVGDMLIVYDFEGGSTDVPTITLRRWVSSGSCEVGSDSPPCWGPSTNLTALGFAEAKVNTFGSVSDAIAPPPPAPPVTLGTSEFGEAGINLTAAGVFSATDCQSFGKAYAVSRSSGNSATAQMKDLVGPGNVNISNCGNIVIRKVTVPSPDPTDTSFAFTLTGGPSALNASFSLKNGESNSTAGANVLAGSGYNAAETVPANWSLTSATCDDGSPVGNIDVSVGETVTCTFTNTLQLGAIQVTKTRKHAADGPGDHPHAGVSFTVNGVTKVTDANGQACFDGLTFGTYAVHETVPAGYHGEADKNVTVDNTATCSDSPYGGETVAFHNTPLTDITVSVNSQVDGGTSSTIDCVVASGSTGANGDGSVTASDLEPGTYVCTVVVDP
jgi:hypothetical protein